MKSLHKLALATALAGSVLPASQAGAVTFNLTNVGGAEVGTQARIGFEMAAAYWSSVLTNTSTVNLNIGFGGLGAGILGSTGSTQVDITLNTVLGAMNATGNSALDAVALAKLNSQVSGGSVNAITNIARLPNGNGVDTAGVEWDADGSENNRYIYGNTAVFKAMGLTNAEGPYAGGTDSFENVSDGGVTFSNSFAWDYDPTDGITAGAYDFIGVAIHEIGHALGFVSGVDLYDAYGYPNGSVRTSGNSFSFDNPGGGLMSTLDLFRYSNDPNSVAPGSEAVLDWSVANAARVAAGGNPFFSIDGENQLFGDSRFSTGRFNGDGRQASHFKDSVSCTDQLGIMDPTYCSGTMGIIKGLDIAAFDAMGWNVNIDALNAGGYVVTTSSIYQQFSSLVPEPATWAMMIAGFGFVGASMRSARRQAKVSFA